MSSIVLPKESDIGPTGGGVSGISGVRKVEDCGEGDRGLAGDDASLYCPNKPFLRGVPLPEVATNFFCGWRASEAAWSRRFVVPKAFVEPERAEHTTATLLSSM